MAVSIREADLDDLTKLRDIFNHYISHSDITLITEELSPDEFRDVWAGVVSADWPFLVAEDTESHDLLGYAYMEPFRPQSAYSQGETYIYLQPESCGKQIGAQLYDELLERVKSHEEISGVVAVMTDDNVASKTFHKKQGFAPCGTIQKAGHKSGDWYDVSYWQLNFPPAS